MPEIYLSAKIINLLKKAKKEGKKTVIANDLMFSLKNGNWTVTSAHTGQEFRVLNL